MRRGRNSKSGAPAPRGFESGTRFSFLEDGRSGLAALVVVDRTPSERAIKEKCYQSANSQALFLLAGWNFVLDFT
jgi:hypothetical protein